MSLSEFIGGYLKTQTVTYLTRENVEALTEGLTTAVREFIAETPVTGQTPGIPNRWVVRATMPANKLPDGDHWRLPQVLRLSRYGSPAVSDKDRTRTKVCSTERQAKGLKTQLEGCGYTVVVVPSYDSLIEVS